MRHLASLALALSLLTPLTADAKPSKRTDSKRWMSECIAERTGPVGGVSKSEARTICSAENPYSTRKPDAPAVARAKAQLKIARAVERAAKAIEACHEVIIAACEDEHGDVGACSDTALKAELAQCGGA